MAAFMRKHGSGRGATAGRGVLYGVPNQMLDHSVGAHHEAGLPSQLADEQLEAKRPYSQRDPRELEGRHRRASVQNPVGHGPGHLHAGYAEYAATHGTGTGYTEEVAPASASRVWELSKGTEGPPGALEARYREHVGLHAAGAPTHDMTVCGPADLWAGPAPYGIAGDASVHPRLPHEVRKAQGKHEGPVLMGGGVGGDGCPIMTSHLRQHPSRHMNRSTYNPIQPGTHPEWDPRVFFGRKGAVPDRMKEAKTKEERWAIEKQANKQSFDMCHFHNADRNPIYKPKPQPNRRLAGAMQTDLDKNSWLNQPWDERTRCQRFNRHLFTDSLQNLGWKEAAAEVPRGTPSKIYHKQDAIARYEGREGHIVGKQKTPLAYRTSHAGPARNIITGANIPDSEYTDPSGLYTGRSGSKYRAAAYAGPPPGNDPDSPPAAGGGGSSGSPTQQQQQQQPGRRPGPVGAWMRPERQRVARPTTAPAGGGGGAPGSEDAPVPSLRRAGSFRNKLPFETTFDRIISHDGGDTRTCHHARGKRVDTPQGGTPQWTRTHGQVSVQTRAVLDHGLGTREMTANTEARLAHEDAVFDEARGPLKKYNDLAALNARTKYGFW